MSREAAVEVMGVPPVSAMVAARRGLGHTQVKGFSTAPGWGLATPLSADCPQDIQTGSTVTVVDLGSGYAHCGHTRQLCR